MIIKLTLVGLILVLISVIALSYYVNKEGFDDISNASSTARVVVTTEVDDIFLNINANTTDGTTIYGAKILYNSNTPVLSPGETTDSTLALNLVIPPTTFTIYNKPLTSFQNGFKYYIVSNNVSKYVEGTTPLLGSFVFNNGGNSSPSDPSSPIAPSSPITPSSPIAPSNPSSPVIPTPIPLTPIFPPYSPVSPSIPQPIPQPPSSSIPTTPQRTDVIPDVSISGTGYDAMNLQQKAELLKDIQKLVRNEILANRSTMPIISGETRKSHETHSTVQGKEYDESCHKDSEYRCPKNPDGSCPPIPDMSQYIKKDSIPCYGCSLDY